MLTALLTAAAVALGPVALDSGASPFAPSPAPAPKVLRLLAPSGAFTAKLLREFEGESGYAVAYDAYGDPARIPSLMKEPYDVVVLPGPALARAIAARQLRAFEKGEVPNARRIAPPVAAKLASYDATGAYGLAWGWSATGLLYDAGKAPRLLGAAPNSWADALAPEIARKLVSCGVALPDARDEMFIAAWRLLGVDPGRIRERDVKAAADLIIRARGAARQPASRDPISAIAGGAVCLTFGNAAQATIASRRSREGSEGLRIRVCRAEGRRSDRDRRTRRTARRAASERRSGADRFPAAPLHRRGGDRGGGTRELRSGSVGPGFSGALAGRRL